MAADAAKEVDDSESRAEAAAALAAQRADRDEVFAKAKSLSKEEKFELVDVLLENQVATLSGKPVA